MSVITDRADGISAAVAMKGPVKVATTANITLSGQQTIDGIAVVEGDRVLVKSQTDAEDNGIYRASTGAWTRTADFDTTSDIAMGTQVLVVKGTVNAMQTFVLTTEAPDLGTDDLTFETTRTAVAGWTAEAFYAGDGSEALPAYSLASLPDSGFILGSGGTPSWAWVINGAKVMHWNATGITVSDDQPASFGVTNGAKLLRGQIDVTADDTKTALRLSRLESDGTVVHFYRAGSAVATINVTTTTITYNTSCDALLKNDRGAMSADDAWDIIAPILIHDFTWKATDEFDHGVFAQELYEIFPRAVTPGGMDDDGNYIPWGVDNSKLVPMLIRVIQDLGARVHHLESFLVLD